MAEVKIVGNINTTTNVSRYKDVDKQIISSKILTNNFGIKDDYLEIYISDITGNILFSNFDYKNYKLPSQYGLNNDGSLKYIEIDPISDLKNLGYSFGEFNVQYNFFRNRITSFTNNFFIKEISSDRTEIRTSCLTLSNNEIEKKAQELINEINSSSYYKDYLLNFGSNIQVVAINVALSKNTTSYEILFKLYEALPSTIDLKNKFWIVDEIIEPYVFEINLDRLVIPDPLPFLRGPNFDIDIDNKNTVSTKYESYNSILSSYQNSISASYHQLLSLTTSQSIDINVDWTNFSNFSKFGSVETRINNFYYKVSQIEDYSNFIKNQTPHIATTSSLAVEISNASASMGDLIANFDGYEHYLYFESSSYAWPKLTSTKPLSLYSTGSSQVQTWMTSSLVSASLYDESNLDILTNIIPLYVTENDSNAPYLTFIQMVGHYFDNIWIYLKSITDINKSDNNLDEGVSKDLVYYALRNIGVKLYNSKGDEDLTNYLVGINSGSFDDNVNLTNEFLDNIPRQDLLTETFKRIYHNVSLLFKSKGTVKGLDALNNIFGVTGSILNIKEFGGLTRDSYLQGYTTDRVRVINNEPTGNVLSPYISVIPEETGSSDYRTIDLHRIDISFSPQNQIDSASAATVAATYPFFNIDDYLGDPRQEYSSSYYGLSHTASAVFHSTFNKTFDYSGFVRLIKFFDNSLFKTLKDYVPARSNTTTGVVIRSPQLERIKIKRVKPTFENQDVLDAEYSGPSISEDISYLYNNIEGDKSAFYNGELSGSYINIYDRFELMNSNPWLGLFYVDDGPTFSHVGEFVSSRVRADFWGFEHSNFNALLNNVSESRKSTSRMLLEPIFVNSLLSGSISSSFAEVQDSYTNLQSHVNSRYAGSKTTSVLYNTYTSASVDYTGDKSYGKTAAIDNHVKKLGLFSEVVSSSFLSKRNNVALKYLVNEFGEFTELNQRNKHWEEVQRTFIGGDTLTVSLFDNQRYNNQKTTDGVKGIFSSGYSYYSMLYFADTDDRLYFQYTGDSLGVLFHTNNLSGYISGSASNMYQITNSKVYNLFDQFDSNYADGNQYYITGSIAGQTFPTFSVPQAGDYSFDFDFGLSLEFPTANASGSYTFKVVNGATELVTQSLAFTSSKYIESFEGPERIYTIGSSFTTSYAYDLDLHIAGVKVATIPAGTNVHGITGSYSLNTISCEGTIQDEIIIFRSGSFSSTPNLPGVTSGIPSCGNSGRYYVNGFDITRQISGFTGTLHFEGSSPLTSFTTGDKVAFQLLQNSVSTNNYTASLLATGQNTPYDGLRNSLQSNQSGNNPYAVTGSNGSFISGSINGDTLVFNSQLSGFVDYLYLPSTGSNTLYPTYGDVDYIFSPKAGDELLITYGPSGSQASEFVISNAVVTSGSLYMTVTPTLPSLLNIPVYSNSTVHTLLLLTKTKDETNVILNFNKRAGKTSYGLIIPSNIHPDVLANIDTITSEIKTKIIEIGGVSGSL